MPDDVGSNIIVRQLSRGSARESGEPWNFRFEDPDPTDRRRMAGLCLTLMVRDRTVGVLEAYGPRTLLDKDNVEILGSLSIQAASRSGFRACASASNW